MKLAHFGTFDVENYGDLLFPLVPAVERLGYIGKDRFGDVTIFQALITEGL